MTVHQVGAFDDMASGTARQVVLGDQRVAVVRCGDAVFAIGDVCSHQDVSLSEGEVLCEDLELECWKHGSTFSLVDGAPQSLPATQAVPVFEARVVDGQIEVVVDG
jgi:3-phenylpropionate/trans-cinnamate dioxygenase ferredoxin subunit